MLRTLPTLKRTLSSSSISVQVLVTCDASELRRAAVKRRDFEEKKEKKMGLNLKHMISIFRVTVITNHREHRSVILQEYIVASLRSVAGVYCTVGAGTVAPGPY